MKFLTVSALAFGILATPGAFAADYGRCTRQLSDQGEKVIPPATWNEFDSLAHCLRDLISEHRTDPKVALWVNHCEKMVASHRFPGSTWDGSPRLGFWTCLAESLKQEASGDLGQPLSEERIRKIA